MVLPSEWPPTLAWVSVRKPQRLWPRRGPGDVEEQPRTVLPSRSVACGGHGPGSGCSEDRPRAGPGEPGSVRRAHPRDLVMGPHQRPGEAGSPASTHARGTGRPPLLEGRGGGVLGERDWVTIIPGCDCHLPESLGHQLETTRTPGSSHAHEFPQVGAHEAAVSTHACARRAVCDSPPTLLYDKQGTEQMTKAADSSPPGASRRSQHALTHVGMGDREHRAPQR